MSNAARKWYVTRQSQQPMTEAPAQPWLTLTQNHGLSRVTFSAQAAEQLDPTTRAALTREPQSALQAREGYACTAALGLNCMTYGPVMFAGLRITLPDAARVWPTWRALARALVLPNDRDDVTCCDALALLLIGSSYPYLPETKDGDCAMPIHVFGRGDCEDVVLLLAAMAMAIETDAGLAVPWVPCVVTVRLSHREGNHVLVALRDRQTDRLYPVDASNGRYPGTEQGWQLDPKQPRLRTLADHYRTRDTRPGATAQPGVASRPFKPIAPAQRLDTNFERLLTVWQVGQRDECRSVEKNRVSPSPWSWATAWKQGRVTGYDDDPMAQEAINLGRAAWARLIPEPMQTLALAPVPDTVLAQVDKGGLAFGIAYPGETILSDAQRKEVNYTRIATLTGVSVQLVWFPDLLTMDATDATDAAPSQPSFDYEHAPLTTTSSELESFFTRAESAIEKGAHRLEKDVNTGITAADRAIKKGTATVNRFKQVLDHNKHLAEEAMMLAAVAGGPDQTHMRERLSSGRDKPKSRSRQRSRGRGRGHDRGSS